MNVRLAIVVAVFAVACIGEPKLAAVAAQYPRGLMATSMDDHKTCTIETRPVSFGTYDALNAQATTTQGQVIYTCGNQDERDAIKNIRIEISAGGAGSFDRRMSSAQDRLSYNLYLDANYHTVWGDGTGGTVYYFDPHPPNKKSVTVPVYGRIPAQQDVAYGQYADTLQARILF